MNKHREKRKKGCRCRCIPQFCCNKPEARFAPISRSPVAAFWALGVDLAVDLAANSPQSALVSRLSAKKRESRSESKSALIATKAAWSEL